MSIVIKGNKPLRLFAMAMLVLLGVSHLMGQIDLLQISFLWLMILMSLNAIQASYTGFCPMFKNSKGECLACGVVCDAETATSKKEKASSCCDSTSGCCDESKPEQSGCCSESNGCDDKTEAKSDCCGDTKNIKVLGSGCANCETTAKLIAEVASQKGITVTIDKVTDMKLIAEYGVMSTPAVVIDEKVVHMGSVPTRDAIEEWLGSSKSCC